jgi:SAM-dependent methyltransferase
VSDTRELEQMWARHAVASADPRTIAATQELIERFEAQFLPRTPYDDDWYGWISLRLDYFYAGMVAAREALGEGGHRFLEVGSGIGSKLCLAHALGWDATGLERHAPYVEASRRLFPHVTVLEGSAEDFMEFADFDLVYAARVAIDRTRQARILRRMVDEMKPGALLFAPSVDGPYPEWLEHLGGFVWRIDGA